MAAYVLDPYRGKRRRAIFRDKARSALLHMQHLARVSKPGRRVYSAARELPRIRNGLGTIIVSTPRGVLSDAEARDQNVGGEVLAEVF